MTEEVDAQERGICQGCGSCVAIQNGETSLHGYERPGNGYTVGRCSGAQHLAANKDQKITKAMLQYLAERIVTLAQDAVNAKARIAQLEAEGISIYSRDERMSAAHKDLSDAKFQKHATEDFITHLNRTAVPAFGTPYTLHAKGDRTSK